MQNHRTKNATLFSQVTLKHGPVGVLGRTMLLAEQLTRQVGVTLSFGTAEDYLAANEANADTWTPLISSLDARFHSFDKTKSFFILGRNEAGDVVACQAGKFLEWDGTNFKDECESLRFLYSDPKSMKLPGERWAISSLAAKGAGGRVAYSGAAWYRPDYRRKGLVEYLPRLSRALAKGLWDSEVTVTVMMEKNVKKGVFPRNGYRNMEWAIDATNGRQGNLRYAFLWTKTDEMVEDLEQFLSDLGPQRDAALRAVGGE
jgi:hypothetical protein